MSDPPAHSAIGPTHRFVAELLELASEDAPLHAGDRVCIEFDSYSQDAEVVKLVDGQPFVRWSEDGTEKTLQLDDSHYPYVESSAFISGVWERHLRDATPDGVAWDDTAVYPELKARLSAHLDDLIAAQPADYHPGSGTKVRDLVHPSLYPYVAGRSALASGATPPPSSEAERDFWGRPYEASEFQWLPTPFRVDDDGSVQIDGTINNLPRGASEGLYTTLEELFSAALPLFENVFEYARSISFYDEALEGEHELPEPPAHVDPTGPVGRASLRGRELQVITKIIEYKLDAGETFEGVWHVEGMSHEHILATGVYTVQRDEALEGGELRFKRPYTQTEAGQLFWNVDQCRPAPVDELVGEGVVPIGSLETRDGRLFVFPNCHIHKLSEMAAGPGAPEARRRVIVFWLVHPDAKILSTREVPPQQDVMSLEGALHVRLQLMEERRRHKQSLNVRAVSLCEH